ncbi:MAG: BNR-4 repeat-containing protein [Pirellulaceae bacterium]
MKGQSLIKADRISRRHALRTALAMGTSGYLQAIGVAKGTKPRMRRFRLSAQGCGRATGYAEANKIVTRGQRTHVAWLDSPPDGFRVRVRTLDHGSGEWSPAYTVGQAHDNHGGPALTIDREGFLHVAYYPHHHAMRYRKSKRPGDGSEWGPELTFGQRLTYPTLVCGQDNTLYLTARRSFSDRPWRVELWKRPGGKETWRGGQALLASRYPGYAHFQESLAWGRDHRTLHLCCRFHEKTDDKGYGRLQAVAYLVSPDAGRSWRRSDGVEVSLPATADSAEILASGGVDHARVLRAGAMAVDPSGRPHLVYSVQEEGHSQLLVASPRGDGNWHRIDLTKFLPDQWSSWNLMAPAGITFTAGGDMVVTAQIQIPREGESSWGNPTNEVVAFRSQDGRDKFSCSLISELDREQSHWLPNIERATGHHPVPRDPGIIYTAGRPGAKNTERLSNQVFFAVAQA